MKLSELVLSMYVKLKLVYLRIHACVWHYLNAIKKNTSPVKAWDTLRCVLILPRFISRYWSHQGREFLSQ